MTHYKRKNWWIICYSYFHLSTNINAFNHKKVDHYSLAFVSTLMGIVKPWFDLIFEKKMGEITLHDLFCHRRTNDVYGMHLIDIKNSKIFSFCPLKGQFYLCLNAAL